MQVCDLSRDRRDSCATLQRTFDDRRLDARAGGGGGVRGVAGAASAAWCGGRARRGVGASAVARSPALTSIPLRGFRITRIAEKLIAEIFLRMN
jgi:hypothetical protein